jgi:tetratricopeptide (TPR) repeat protein
MPRLSSTLSARPSATVFCLRAGALVLVCAGSVALAQNLPPSLEAQVAPGIEALKLGDLDQAEKVFSDALRHGIRHPLVFHNLGVIAQQRGNFQQAVVRFREAIALEPDHGPTRLLLGSCLLALGKKAEAVRELNQAVHLMPREPQARLQLAKAYEASGSWLPAVEQFEKLVELAPENTEYSYLLGRAYGKLSEWSYQQISEINSDSARLHQALGQEYVIQEKYDQALEAYQKAAHSDPRLPEIHLAMALLYLQLKQLDQALAEVKLEQELVPESKAAEETKAKIEAAKAARAP